MMDCWSAFVQTQPILGDITELYREIRAIRSDINLRLVHKSCLTLTGNDEDTMQRLKYVELWFSSKLDDLWEVREDGREGRH